MNLHVGTTPWRSQSTGSATELVEQAQLAEELGLESFWLPESHFVKSAIPAPLMSLAAVAAGTRTIRLGTTSYLLPIRQPILAAEEVAVLDRLSEGRVILGGGRGFREALFDVFEVDRREKRSLFQSALTRMIDAWQGAHLIDSVEASCRLVPGPVQQPHPPIWVAAFGPKALRQAGSLGLPYLASPMETTSQLRANSGHYLEGAEANGAQPAAEVPVMRTVFVHEDRRVLDVALEALESETAAWRRTRSARLRPSEDVSVHDRAIVGTPEEVSAKVAEYRRDLGLTHLIARPGIGGLSTEVVEESLQLMTEVLGRTEEAAQANAS